MKSFFEIETKDIELYNRKVEYIKNFVLNFYDKVKEKPNVLSASYLNSRQKSFNFFKVLFDNKYFCEKDEIFGLKSGIVITQPTYTHIRSFSIYFIYGFESFEYVDWDEFELSRGLDYILNKVKSKNRFKKYSAEDVNILNEFLSELYLLSKKFDRDLQNELDDKLQLEKQQEIERSERIKKEKEQLKESKKTIIQKLDTDNNGEIDLIDNDFPKLLSKYQKQIIGIDKNYIHQFVKVSNYISTKKNNIQLIFKSIDKINSKTDLDKRINLLKNQVHTYDLFIFHSLNMIEALVSEDLITFYEIYEKFDKIGIYNSNWENEVSTKLTSIGSNLASLSDKLDSLLDSIAKMEENIVSEIGYMNYSTQESFGELNDSLTSSLKSINSSVDVNNLFTAINTYQLYKINKQTKSLLPKK